MITNTSNRISQTLVLKKNLIKKSNDVLSRKVLETITGDPILDSSKIDVSVKDGIVALARSVNNYTQKRKLESLLRIFQELSMW
jgi:osmotically-inducible protein OsmY